MWRLPLRFGLFAAALVMPGAAPGQSIAPPSVPVVPARALGPAIDGGTRTTLALPADLPATFAVDIPAGPHAGRLILTKYLVRASNSRVLVEDEPGRLTPVKPAPASTYRGTVEGVEGAQVAASIIDGQLHAIIFTPGGQTWGIEPAPNPDLANQHVVYTTADMRASPGTCGLTTTPNPLDPDALIEAANVELDEFRLQTLLWARIAFDADYEYYNVNRRDPARVQAEIELLLNATNLAYERACRLSHVLGDIIIRTTEDDPYTGNDSVALRDQFRAHWIGNHQGVSRDIAYMMSGRTFTDNHIGIAFLGGMCGSPHSGNGYAISASFVSTFIQRVTLMAHELGHTWNAEHCNQLDPPVTPCTIMCSAIDSCSPVGAPDFDPYSAAVIRQFAAGRTCLDPNSPIIWVDFNYSGSTPNGSYTTPFTTFNAALAFAQPGQTIAIKGGSSNETTGRITTPLTLEAFPDATTIGR
ncbi:MAG: M12 family metallo-peptidase [Planctomycetota bacterium]|nr:M12 family metallo-peptidase [Planctomycetota bacterium]